MKEQTKREQLFLERLGITPGPWELYIDKLSIVVMDEKRIDQFIATIPKKTNAKLIAHSPDMFLSLFGVMYRSEKDYGLLAINSPSCKIIESATGKTFQQLCKLWEDCEE